MRELWTRLERWFARNGIDAQLRPGASSAELSREPVDPAPFEWLNVPDLLRATA